MTLTPQIIIKRKNPERTGLRAVHHPAVGTHPEVKKAKRAENTDDREVQKDLPSIEENQENGALPQDIEKVDMVESIQEEDLALFLSIHQIGLHHIHPIDPVRKIREIVQQIQGEKEGVDLVLQLTLISPMIKRVPSLMALNYLLN